MPLDPSYLKALDDSVRADLASWRDWYTSCIFWSTLAVVVGCVMEIPEVLHELWESLFPERFVKPIKIASSIGLMFVVLGVAGELCFEHFESEYQGLIEYLGNVLLVDAQRQALAAQSEAASAASSAKIAHEESDGATTASGKALNIASGARREADSFERDIVTAKQQSASATKQAAEAESHLADALQRAAHAERELEYLRTPRSLKDIPSLVAALAPFKGTRYEMDTFQDDEAFSLTRSVDAALQAAGWVRKEPPFRIGITSFNLFGNNRADAVPVCANIGIQVHILVREPANELEARAEKDLPKVVRSAIFLRAALAPHVLPEDARNVGAQVGLDTEEFGMTLTEQNPIVVCIGKKP